MNEAAPSFDDVYDNAFYAFEHPPLPPMFARPADVSLISLSGYENSDVFHIWLDSQQQTTHVTRIFWRTNFDRGRFNNEGMKVRYGQSTTPSLITANYQPSFAPLEQEIAFLLGCVPVFMRESLYDRCFLLHLRLPLGEMSILINYAEELWPLREACHRLHHWLLSLPKLPKS